MAAERLKNSTASCNKNGGFSYANAVLNFKPDEKIESHNEKCLDDGKCKTSESDKSNKENEHSNENVNENIEEENKPNDPVDNTNGKVDDHDDDDFIAYSDFKRKKKMAKMKKKEISSQQTSLNKNSSVRYEKVRPKRKDKLIPINDNNVVTPAVTCDNVKYVEAPVPKVNPWTKNKNAASVIKGSVVKPNHVSNSCKYSFFQYNFFIQLHNICSDQT